MEVAVDVACAAQTSFLTTLRLAFQLGYRNLWRRKRRTLLTIASITVATGLVVFFFGIQLSAWTLMVESATGLFQGQAQVQSAAYWEKPRFESTIDQSDQLLGVLDRTSGVIATAPRVSGFALVSSGERTYGVQILGVLPDRENAVSRLPSLIREGTYISEEPGAVLGRSLARNLRVTVGSELTFLGQGKDGSLAAFIVPVQGIFESGSSEVDRALVQIPLAFMQENFSLEQGVHLVALRLDETVDIEKLQSFIQRQLPADLVFLRWDQYLAGLKELITLDAIAGWLFFLSLIVISTFIVANTIAMSVLERTHEFGVMLAIGTHRQLLFWTVLAETLTLCAIGIGLGLIIGLIAILYFQHYGFWIPGAEEVSKIFSMPAVLYPYPTLLGFTLVPFVILFLATLGTLPSSYRASRLAVVESLRSR